MGVGREGAEQGQGGEAETEAMEPGVEGEAGAQVPRLPARTELAAEHRMSVLAEEVAGGTMAVRGLDAQDGRIAPRQGEVEGGEVPRPLAAEDLPQIRLEPPLGGGVQLPGNGRRDKVRDPGIEIVRHGQADAAREHPVDPVGALLRRRRGEWDAVEASQRDHDMDVVAVRVGMPDGDPRRAQRRQPHEFELLPDDPDPGAAVGDKMIGQRQGHVQDAPTAGELVHPGLQESGARPWDRSADPLRTVPEHVVRDHRCRGMECVVRAHPLSPPGACEARR
ncbi:hypothetical protein OCH239_17180 [Roseivivax halodurans JCM 10272]|uniref:Uncharacterized protein n=1 Tax=Roseivivax halodurans JCM 10272 TaxID=1449350 RepID=X7E9K1_9RHOB|nr:hypothetical protein OCH239_17180 [Roseivivax halodurans JCM 10272]